MAKREIWWERWGAGYKPVRWQAWAWLGAFCCSIWLVLFGSEWLARMAGFPNERVVAIICLFALLGWGYWFVESRTAPCKR